MALNLTDYEKKAKEAVKLFWSTRESAKLKQKELGKVDQGERGSVTAGKNMDGFLELIIDVIKANGLPDAEIHLTKRVLSLPGFYRPTKQWDVLVTYQGNLLAAIELKSQVGPSFGNNFNNRTEEAIGTAHDFWVAEREGAFGTGPAPFVGWLMMVEDSPKSRCGVKVTSPHFNVFEEFDGASYLKRYQLLCQKLMQERLYTCASVLTSERAAIGSGVYSEMSDATGLKTFLATLAGHISSAAMRLK